MLQLRPSTAEVENLPAKQETQVLSLGWEDALGRAWQRTPVVLPGDSHGQGAWRATVHGVPELDTTEGLKHTHKTNLGDHPPQCVRGVSERAHASHAVINVAVLNSQNQPTVLKQHLSKIRKTLPAHSITPLPLSTAAS